MGNSTSIDTTISPNENRELFIEYKEYKRFRSSLFGEYMVYVFLIHYRRYTWEINVRFNEVVRLERRLRREMLAQMNGVCRLEENKSFFAKRDDKFFQTRSMLINKFLQQLADKNILASSILLKQTLKISNFTLDASLGRKGMEGYLWKSSGGFTEKFSRRTGDFLNIWRKRWIVANDTCVTWYESPDDTVPKGSLQIDSGFLLSIFDRVLAITTSTRKLVLRGSTTRESVQWYNALKAFYSTCERTLPQQLGAMYPIRPRTDLKVYTITRDYFSTAAHSLLSAQKEILIMSWKLSPMLIMTRPPLPALRLDQILKFKAEQGVKIFVLLYKEVDYVGNNDSNNAKIYLESLSKNIRCIRHPNKLFGGSTAMLWSHHEKVIVIDRNLCYLGGVDLSVYRYDDELHRVADEDGHLYPGPDYRQPAPGLFKPVKPVSIISHKANKSGQTDYFYDDEADEIEVELSLGYEALPSADIMTGGAGDEIYEAEVVMDFSVQNQPIEISSSSPSTSKNSTAAAATAATASPKSPVQKRVSNLPVISETEELQSAPEEEDRMSDVSENWAEDRYHAETPEEKKAIHAIGRDDDSRSIAASDIQDGPSTIFTEVKSHLSKAKNSMQSAMDYFAGKIIALSEQASSLKREKHSKLEMREAYPRMPWHDVQMSVSGAIARDVASHFVQRWNHHRLSTSQYQEPSLIDITDQLNFGVCARCRVENISETVDHCPSCGYFLGSTNPYSAPISLDMVPATTTDHSYILFQCSYVRRLLFKMQGDSPAVVTSLLYPNKSEQTSVEGELIDVFGPNTEHLLEVGTSPTLGDIIVAIDDIIVTHLNANQIYRIVRRKREAMKLVFDSNYDDHPPCVIKVTFRRHYMENFPQTKAMNAALGTMDGIGDVVNSPDIAIATAEPDFYDATNEKIAQNNVRSHEPVLMAEDSTAVSSGAPVAGEHSLSSASVHRGYTLADDNDAVNVDGGSAAAMTTTESSQASTPPPSKGTAEFSPVSPVSPVSAVMETSTAAGTQGGAPHEALSMGGSHSSHGSGSHSPMSAVSSNGSELKKPECGSPSSGAVTAATRSSVGPASGLGLPQYIPICVESSRREVLLSMAEFYHTCGPRLDVLGRLTTGTGTCKTRLLRSVGKWSVGTKTEQSIHAAWVETIKQAQHLVYIESQFFIGNVVGEAASNNIPLTIVERIVRAFQEKTPFRVIIVLPIHPNGDFTNDMKSKNVLHFQEMTICKGTNSMIRRILARAPGINISDYLTFHSLRSWGVLSNKVVSDQVYVHDKLLIVDDRVAIIGSANCNDRSMLGFRDSELAIMFEDDLQFESTFAGRVCTVGYAPHALRLRLMRQHVGSESADVVDILNPSNFEANWMGVSRRNSTVYDEIDGNLSVYRCQTITAYHAAVSQYNHKSYLDPMVRSSVEEIQGFLVDYPLRLLIDDDLSPSLATRSFVPNELWL